MCLVFNNSEGLYSNIKCPKCGARHFEVEGSLCTAVYHPLIIKDGKVQPTGHNTSWTTYKCLECGNDWEEEDKID